jgi:hypothetical protein
VITVAERTAEELRADAARAEQSAIDSFERSDTDGFLSQWASGISARLYRAQADLLDKGGVSDFLGLFTEDGERVKARLVNGQYGLVWAVLDEQDNVGVWVGYPDQMEATDPPSKRTKMGKLGLHMEWESAPAKAKIAANGTGLSGAATAHVSVYRTDGGFPEGAKVIV